MSSPTKTSPPTALDRNRDGIFGPDHGGPLAPTGPTLPMPGLSGRANSPTGNLLKGPVDDAGKLKDAALMVGIKLDLEAEIHLTARVRGDVLVGLY
ncbi:Uu.00g099350.m01.CDS01 [Anthostomella pinea]|uniref:Uu.00g099350.m01.CDS01 n=1 Tax=Anthostomella pinea TaxID=933095 RepID=A0AAI8VDS9_9PEZI|nr:Uu.00g099350.m01.CDS01 [Anthostomella pinea]